MRASLVFTALLGIHQVYAFKVLEELPAVPSGWEHIGSPDTSQPMAFRIAVTQHDEGLFERTLYAISDPADVRYGQHLKRDELKALLRPSSTATSAVIGWLQSCGIPHMSIDDDGDWISFIAPNVSVAEDLLNTQFGEYQNRAGDRIIRTLQYSVPRALHQHVDMIQPTTRFGAISAQRTIFHSKTLVGNAGDVKIAADGDCNQSTSPSCLRRLYKIPDNALPNNQSAGSMASSNFLLEYPRYDDLKDFEKEFAPYAVGQNFTWESANGGLLDQNSNSDGSEANLDAQYLLAMGAPVPLHTYSTGGQGPLDPDAAQPTQPGLNEPYLDFLYHMAKVVDSRLPHTITTSYGEDEQSVPLNYRTRVCKLFGELGARGVSIIFSSGDWGTGLGCISNDGKNTTKFLPTFPASCPYVTTVGGTFGTSPEQAISFSSGGFSDTFARPAYQDNAITAYLQKLGTKWDGYYNKTGRGFPDVAAQSYNFPIIDRGEQWFVSGTSASAPTFAGVVALLNAKRLQAGKKPLGFLNLWIYSVGYKGLNDITAGGSTGCGAFNLEDGSQIPGIPYASWNATAGWDPVTGYGSPDYSKLLPLALNATA